MQLLFLLLFSCFSFLSVAQTPDTAWKEEENLVPLDFSQERLDRLRQDPDFNYAEASESNAWWSSFKRYIALQWNRLLNWIFGSYQPPLLLAIFLDILPYLLLGLLLFLILYLFSRFYIKRNASEEKQRGTIIFDEEEKIVRSRDISKMISKAVAKENYRLAVRYHFLYILQQLSANRLVTYNNAKTGEDYLLELQGNELQKHFKKLNRIYTFTWYGHFSPTAERYVQIAKEFQKAEQQIKAGHEQDL